MKEVMPFLLALVCRLAQGEWSAPDSIPIHCGKSTCDIWTEYCHFRMCMKCNTDVCSMSLSPGGRPVQCYFYCMEVKKMMQMQELDGATSPKLQTSTTATFTKAPAQQTIPEEERNSSDVQYETVLMVLLPMISYVCGIGTVALYLKYCRKRNGEYSKDTLNSHPPQGSYSGTTDPQDAAELAISAKLMQEK